MLRFVAGIVVFIACFLLLSVVHVVMAILGGQFWPFILISLAVSLVFIILDVLSSWNRSE
jgi:hypothetical protein